jgi:hypothetical protein
MGDTLLTTLRERLRRGTDPDLLATIEKAVQACRAARGEHADWGLLCEEAGLFGLAFREFQLALRDNPQDPVAGFRLAQHYRERGETGRAADLLEGLLQAEPAREDWLGLYAQVLHQEGARPRLERALKEAVQHGLAPAQAEALARGGTEAEEDEEAAQAALDPTDADCVRFQGLFAGREDVHARQWAGPGGDGGYSPVQEPLTPAVVRNHLLGTYTVGVYPIRLDETCTFFALDLDIDRAALEEARARPERARCLRDAVRSEGLRLRGVLHELGFAPVLEDSGYKGRHLWVFLDQPEPAGALHLLGRLLLGWQQPQLPPGLHLEFFPKQAGRKGKGLGNLIKLPLGIHRRTGRRALLLDGAGRPLPQPLAALRQVIRAPRPALHAALERLKLTAENAAVRDADKATEKAPAAAGPPGPPPPPPAPAWTEGDFDADPRVRHLLARCPVLAELKRAVDEHRRLSHEEQLVLAHSLGHVEGGPQAVNYLLGRCVDVGPEKLLKDRLKGNPVSCPSIRKKIGHVTRRVACNCAFDFAPDRYPTPVLHLLTLEGPQTPGLAQPADLETLARRYAVLVERRDGIQRECGELQQALVLALRALPGRSVACPGGRYRLIEEQGVEELRWEPDAPPGPVNPAAEGDVRT